MITFARHKGGNGLNCQAICIANGLIIGFYGPAGGRRQDPFMFAEWGILGQLQEHAAAAAVLFPHKVRLRLI